MDPDWTLSLQWVHPWGKGSGGERRGKRNKNNWKAVILRNKY
jgi:hypothetical protein